MKTARHAMLLAAAAVLAGVFAASGAGDGEKPALTVVADSLSGPSDTTIAAICKVVGEVRKIQRSDPKAKIELVPFANNEVANRELLFLRDKNLSVRGKEKVREPDHEAGSHLWRKWWWFERLVERQGMIRDAGKEVDLVMMGDSITHHIDRQKTWQDLKGRGINVLNLGYGGDHAETLAWRAKNGELDGYRAKVVTIMIGTNNQGRNDTVETTVKAIAEAVSVVREKQPQAKILLHAILPRSSVEQGRLRARSLEVSRRIRSLCDGENVIWFDMRPLFAKEDGTGRFDLLPDGTHLSASGARTWLRALAPYVLKYTGKNIDFDPEASGLKPCDRKWINFAADFSDDKSARRLFYFAVTAQQQGYNGVCVGGFDAATKWDAAAEKNVKQAVSVLREAGIELIPVVTAADGPAFEPVVAKVEAMLRPANWFVATNGADRAELEKTLREDAAILAKTSPSAGVTLFAPKAADSFADLGTNWTHAVNGDVNRKTCRDSDMMLMAYIENLKVDWNLLEPYHLMKNDKLCTGGRNGFLYWTDKGDYRYMLDAIRIANRRD